MLLAALTIGCVGGRQLIKKVDLRERLKVAYDQGFETGQKAADAQCWDHTQALAVSQYETANNLEAARAEIKRLEKRFCLDEDIDAEQIPHWLLYESLKAQ